MVRKDGHHPIIHMQCGPVRHRVEAKAMAGFEKFRHSVEVRLTGFEPSVSVDDDEQGATYVKLIAELMNDAHRNEMIVSDVLKAVAAGRSPVVQPERREHLEILRGLLEGKALQKSICVVFPTDNGSGIVHNVRRREERRIRPGGWDAKGFRTTKQKRGAL